MVEFNTSWLQGLVHVQLPIEAVGNLASEANFARFWFARLFPGLKRALYLDADVVVQSDISLLWGSVASSQQLLAVVERGSPTYGDVFGDKVMAMFRERLCATLGDYSNVIDHTPLFVPRYKRSFKNDHPTFNAGVYGVNLDLWRQKMIHKEVLYWMKEVCMFMCARVCVCACVCRDLLPSLQQGVGFGIYINIRGRQK